MEDLTRWLTSEGAFRAYSVIATLGAVFLVTWLIQSVATRSITDPTSRYRARKVVRFLGFLAAGVTLVVVFAPPLSQLTILLGGIGAGVAFALQEVIASVAGWAAVSFGGYFQVGDRVQLGGIKGDVIDIGPLRTTLMEVGQWVNGDQYNGRVVRIANSYVFKEPVVNYSGDFPFLWDEVVVPIRFGSDLAVAQGVIEEAALGVCGDYSRSAEKVWREIQRRHPLEDARTGTAVTMSFDANWVTFSLRYVVAYDRRRSTKDALSRRILDGITATGGSVRVAIASMEVLPGRPVEDVAAEPPRHGEV